MLTFCARVKTINFKLKLLRLFLGYFLYQHLVTLHGIYKLALLEAESEGLQS